MTTKLLSVFVFLLFSCSEGHRLKREMEKFYYSTVKMPDNLVVNYNGTDTVINNIFESKVKFIVYLDSLGCGSCSIKKMDLWNPLIRYANNSENKLKIYFIFNPAVKDLNSIKIALKSYPVNYPVFIDEKGTFKKHNPLLPKDKLFHCFMLDDSNKVVLVGNPLGNNGIGDVFYKKVDELLK